MSPYLTCTGYLSTQRKLANMEARLAALRVRADLDPGHRAAVERSYLDMMRQHRRDVMLYEEIHPTSAGA